MRKELEETEKEGACKGTERQGALAHMQKQYLAGSNSKKDLWCWGPGGTLPPPGYVSRVLFQVFLLGAGLPQLLEPLFWYFLILLQGLGEGLTHPG